MPPSPDLSASTTTTPSPTTNSTTTNSTTTNTTTNTSSSPLRLVLSKTPAADKPDTYLVHTSIVPPTGATRTPSDVVCVVDISGSMDSSADVQDASGNVESSGLSLLDVTKHAIRTVVSTLNDNDRLGIISYSDSGRKELDLTKMNDAGKGNANDKTEGLQTEGCTNLWDGLLKALELFRDAPPNTYSRNQTILLLTDGQPNREPPRGHIPSLKNFFDKHPELSSISINTFAFGYGAKSDLLEDIAREGSGTFTFVPDAGFVGTGFVNSLANVLSTCAVNAKLSVEVESGASVKTLSVSNPFQAESWGGIMNVGTIQHGQSKDVVFEVSAPSSSAALLLATLTYELVGSSGGKQSARADISTSEPEPTQPSELLYHSARADFCDTMTTALELQVQGDADDAMKSVKAFIKKYNTALKTTPMDEKAKTKITDIIKDATGQVTEAFSREDYFRKWGRHYIPSLRQAHETQRCNNFKDFGIQHYGGSIFGDVRDFADDAFNKLPPPTPSRRTCDAGAPSYRPINMASTYNNCYGGCVAGDARVLMSSGSTLNAKNIIKGDIVAVAGGGIATVRCVIKTNSDASGKMALVKLPGGGPLITPWHPIRKNGSARWVFPADLELISLHDCASVFTFVLDNGHEMIIDGYHYASLGHGKTDEVVRHSFWGDMAAITRSLSQCKGFRRGLVEFTGDNAVKKNGIAVGFNVDAEVLNETKTSRSQLINEVQLWTAEMSDDETEERQQGKGSAAQAKLTRNSQRPRVTRACGSSKHKVRRGFAEEIAFAREEMAF